MQLIGSPPLLVYTSDEDVGSPSEDDEDFIIPSKYIRITTVSGILSNLPNSHPEQESERDPEIILDPQVIANHEVHTVVFFWQTKF